MKTYSILIIFLNLVVVFFGACNKNSSDDDQNNSTTEYSKIENTLGFGLLNKVKGIWNGPVTSTTRLGSYPEWIVDFRPISENQISSKNELDTENDIHMSFFIAKYNGEYRLCFRNGGMFAGNTRVSYFLADSVRESSTESYYRFSEIVKGESRAYTQVTFSGNEMLLQSYTNSYNTLNKPSLHMTWEATLQDTTSCQAAVGHFSFPKKTLTKDFSNAFEDINEAIFYNSTSDPYSENEQPYLGVANLSYSFSSSINPDNGKKVFLFTTTEPLSNGISPNLNALKFRSRYVVLSAADLDFTFTSMHPGDYYVYALYDADGNGGFSSGDALSTPNISFSLGEKDTVSATNEIDFVIP